MQNFKQLVNNFVSDESGQDLIEYALVTALVALAAISTMKSVASNINTVFNSISTTLSSAA